MIAIRVLIPASLDTVTRRSAPFGYNVRRARRPPGDLRVPRQRGRDGRGADDRARRRARARLALGAAASARRSLALGVVVARARAGADARCRSTRCGWSSAACCSLRPAVAAQGDPARERLKAAARRGRDLRQRAREARDRAARRASRGLDWYGFTLSFKGVFLEGLEVAFIVLTFGSTQGEHPARGARRRRCGRARRGRRASSSARRSPGCPRTR